MKILFKLLIALCLLTTVNKVAGPSTNSLRPTPQFADGSSCTPWTPTTCFPGTHQRSLRLRPEMEADGGVCTPWTPTTCIPRAKLDLLDGSQCTPWTPTTCIPGLS